MPELIRPAGAAPGPRRETLDQPTPLVLTDGQVVPVRRIQPSDAARLQQGFSQLSPRSIHYRFFSGMSRLPDGLARHLAEVDHCNRCALVAQRPEEPEQLIAVARFDRGPRDDEAELAVVVGDPYRGLGLGRGLLSQLVLEARACGINRLHGLALADNQAVIRLLRGLGHPTRLTWEEAGVYRIELAIAPELAAGADTYATQAA